jgi:UDP-glucose 4-epimerase
MRVLVTGSAGHLGEALMRTLPAAGHEAIGIDVLASPFTHHVGSIVDRGFVRRSIDGVDAVVHTATLHKPHVATHSRQAFVDTNITGTLNLLEEAVAARARAFVFTSTTSAFGRALVPPPGAPAAWITEEVVPVPKNIYGVTKVAAENLCELLHHRHGLPCLILRTSRFFPEPDDRRETREAYADANAKANEFLFRRADIADIVDAHLLALERAAANRVRPLHRQRHHAVHAGRPGRAADRRPRLSSAAACRATHPCMRPAAGRCSPASTASTTTRGHAAIWAGGRSSTSPASCRTSRQAARRAAP